MEKAPDRCCHGEASACIHVPNKHRALPSHTLWREEVIHGLIQSYTILDPCEARHHAGLFGIFFKSLLLKSLFSRKECARVHGGRGNWAADITQSTQSCSSLSVESTLFHPESAQLSVWAADVGTLRSAPLRKKKRKRKMMVVCMGRRMQWRGQGWSEKMRPGMAQKETTDGEASRGPHTSQSDAGRLCP